MFPERWNTVIHFYTRIQAKRNKNSFAQNGTILKTITDNYFLKSISKLFSIRNTRFREPFRLYPFFSFLYEFENAAIKEESCLLIVEVQLFIFTPVSKRKALKFSILENRKTLTFIDYCFLPFLLICFQFATQDFKSHLGCINLFPFFLTLEMSL